MTGETTVYVVDDDPALRDSLRWLLSTVGLRAECFHSGESFLAAFDAERPGCILLDVRMPGLGGIEVLRRLAREPYVPPVIVVSGHADVPLAVEVLKEGAEDFLVKPFRDQQLVERLREAIGLDHERRGRSRERSEARRRLALLTPREREVFETVAAGKPNKVIASELGLSPKTVEVHRARAMEKMGAASLAELVRLAIAAGVIDASPGGERAGE